MSAYERIAYELDSIDRMIVLKCPECGRETRREMTEAQNAALNNASAIIKAARLYALDIEVLLKDYSMIADNKDVEKAVDL